MEKSEKEKEKVPLEEKGPEDDQSVPEKVSEVSKDHSIDHDTAETLTTTVEETVVKTEEEKEEKEEEKEEIKEEKEEEKKEGKEEIKEKKEEEIKEEKEEEKKEEKEEEIKEEKEEEIKEGKEEEIKEEKEEKKEEKEEEIKNSAAEIAGIASSFVENEDISETLKPGTPASGRQSEEEEEKEGIKEEKIGVKEEKEEEKGEKKEKEEEKVGVKEEKEGEKVEKEKIGKKEEEEEKARVKEEKEGEKEEKEKIVKEETGEKKEKEEEKREKKEKEEEKEGVKEEKEGEKEEKEKIVKEEKEEEKGEKKEKEEKEGVKEEEKGSIKEENKGDKDGEKKDEEGEKVEERKLSPKDERKQIISEEKNSEEKRIPTPPELDKIDPEEDKEEKTKLMPNSALNIDWSFSFNQSIPVWNLTDSKRNLIMYTSSHTGIIYDYKNNTQSILQGHANSISCTSLSADKKWLVTADKGKDNTVIIWNTYTCFPVRTLFNASPNGMEAVALTPDAKYLATMSAGDLQEFVIWDWTVSDDKPLASVTLDKKFSGSKQNYIFFCEENFSYIVTNSENQVIFYQWKDESLNYFAPPLTDQDFHIQIGKYSQSIIIEDTIHALTATSVGNLVVWDTHISMMEGKKRKIANKKASKIIKLIPCGITVLTLHDTYIVTGDVNGNVSFFDQRMTLLHCFNKLGFGPVKSLSFSFVNDEVDQNIDQYPQTCTVEAEQIVLPDFTLSSSTAQCGLILVEGPQIQVLIRDHGKTIPAIATHPFKPFLATGSHAGFLKVYDYMKKVSISSRTFEKEMIESCAFSPDGYHLAVGFVSGVIQVLDSFTLKAEPSDIHRYSKQAIIQVVFSDNSDYLAAADMGFVTSLLKKHGSSFIFLGRYQAHYKPIRQLMFGEKFNADEPRLLSLGEDRMLVEYDLVASTLDDVRILSIERIEQSATPRCMAWHPPLNKEHFIVTANDQYKYKLYNSTTMMCRKTTLAPIYEYPIAKLIVLPTKGIDPKHMYMTFITQDKVGLQILPFDGNPHQSTALIAHPGGVHNLVASYDGAFLFTTSSQEPSVHMWRINASALEAQLRLGGEDLIPFYRLLEGGQEGPFFEELKEYFYYCQLQSSDINSMSTREVSKTIPVKQIPYMMRALGFYPSEQELADMVNEIKYSEYVDKGEFKEEINLPDFLKLYINHRPYRNLMCEKLKWAFDVLGEWNQQSEESSIPTNEMLNLIQSQGEHITSEELDEILMDLCLLELDCSNELGNCKDGGKIKDFSHLAHFIDNKLPEVMTAPAFANKLLTLPENIFET